MVWFKNKSLLSRDFLLSERLSNRLQIGLASAAGIGIIALMIGIDHDPWMLVLGSLALLLAVVFAWHFQQSTRTLARLQSILDVTPAMIGYWDRNYRNRYANPAYLNWFGVDPGGLTGRHIRELLGADLFEKNRPYMEAALRGDAQIFERTIPKPDGSGSRHSLAYYLPDLRDGAVQGFYVLVHDVTELHESRRQLRETEVLLRQALTAAEAANAAKSEFLANMSHEIRTPLTAVLGLSHLLEQTPLTERQRELLGKVRGAGRALLGIVNNVLDLSKIEAGQIELDIHPFDLNDLLDEIRQWMTTEAESKALNIQIDPAPADLGFIAGDMQRTRQILINLLNNAIKFTEHGSVTLSTTWTAIDTETIVLRFVVQDSGIGIDTAVLPKIFAPFTQADASTTRRFGGTGLGLSIVRHLTTIMGGDVTADSALGIGSKFSVQLPMQRCAQPVAVATSIRIGIDAETELAAALSELCTELAWEPYIIDATANASMHFDAIVVDDRHNRTITAEISQAMPCIIVPRNNSEAIAPQPFAAHAIAMKLPLTAANLFNAVATACWHSGDAHKLATHSIASTQTLQWLCGVRVLVVDDSETNRELASYILLTEGAEVTSCANGSEALDALTKNSHAFDLVLMDIQMPVMGGYEATYKLRSELGLTTLPVIALTAGALRSDRQRAFDVGFSDFLIKPLEPETLIRSVRQHVEAVRHSNIDVYAKIDSTNSAHVTTPT